MWSNEHFTNRQRHKKKKKQKNHQFIVGTQQEKHIQRCAESAPNTWQRYKEGQFWKDFNSMLTEYWGQFGFKDEIRKLFKRSMNNHRNVPIWIQADVLELKQNLLSKQ